jgi:hypothetical protein
MLVPAGTIDTEIALGALIDASEIKIVQPSRRSRNYGRVLKPKAWPLSQCRHKAPFDKFGWGLDKGQIQKMELL